MDRQAGLCAREIFFEGLFALAHPERCSAPSTTVGLPDLGWWPLQAVLMLV
jgi:hypothetical protein